MQTTGITGSRRGKPGPLVRWAARFAAAQMVVLPVPGEEILRASGIDLHELHFDVAANPRDANVMLIAGPVSHELGAKAAVAWVQMPRPRVLVFAGVDHVPQLSDPDITIPLDKQAFSDLKQKIKEILSAPFRADAAPFEAQEIRKKPGSDEDEHQHHQHDHDGDMDHGHQHGEGMDHDHHDGGGMDHNHADHGGGMGFMSMVAMTKDIPPAADGLRMDHNQVWFGPFFPGLPGGLACHLTIDGDTVVSGKIHPFDFSRDHIQRSRLPLGLLSNEIGNRFPCSSFTYRMLAHKLLEKSGGGNARLSYDQIANLERDRIVSHLNWLATFGVLAGNHWLHRQAVRQMMNVQQNKSPEKLDAFISKVLKFSYLKKKLRNTGEIPGYLLHHAEGPVARAAGRAEDERSNCETYRNLDFTPVTADENNAWGRLQIRLFEIRQSLDLIKKCRQKKTDETVMEQAEIIRPAEYVLEGPRGPVRAGIAFGENQSVELSMIGPSGVHAGLSEQVIAGTELSDALLAIASFDLDPYSLKKFRIQQPSNLKKDK